MVGQSLWKNLKALVSLDEKIKSLKEEINQTENLLKKDKENIPLLEEEIKKFEKEYLDEKKNVARIELDAKELKDKEDKQKTILENISSPKEYKAAEKELKTISSKRLELDDLLVQTWHNLEEKENLFKKEQTTKLEQITQLQEGFQVQHKLLADLEIKITEIKEQRKDIIKNIPENWYQTYEKMIQKVSDPIVPVVGNSCSACYYSILRQDLAKLKKSVVLPCRNCYRFLYCEEEEEQREEQIA